MKNLFFRLILFNCIFLFGATKDEDPARLKFKVALATRTEVAPAIDGLINDDAWVKAVEVNEFLQLEPYNLQPPSAETVVRVLYDDDFLYVAFDNKDPNPEEIIGRTVRRDDWMTGFDNNGDWVGIGIDSRNDDRTGYWFAINPAGSIIDTYISGEGMEAFDASWDAVWEAMVNINESGWTAEFRIPFNVFQFSSAQEQEWGIQFNRMIYRMQEEVLWPGRSLGARGFVPHYGILQGIKDIPQPHQLELMPYILGGQTSNGEIDNTRNYGLDAQYSLTSNTTMNLTFNPDFGQVEADPSILNLTAFETRLDERRPFFVEGAGFFKNRVNLFHSRRIGQRPGYYQPDEGSIVKRPDATTILGAAKILGETSTGLRYGIIEAVTDEEFGTWDYDVNGELVREKFLLEPYTNYFIGRVEKAVINDLSTIGFMATDLRRQDAGASNAFNMDWKLNFIDNRLSFNGQTAQSRTKGAPGYAGRFSVGYRDLDWWELRAWGGFIDDIFNINDMGFQRRNNNWDLGIRAEFRKDEPWGRFLNNTLSIRWGQKGRGDGLVTYKNLEVEQENTFKNYWSMEWSAAFSPEVFEDDDLFRDPRALIIRKEATQFYNFSFQTDRRKRFILEPGIDLFHGETRGWGLEYGLILTLRPTEYINMSIFSSKDITPESMQWVGIVEDSVRTNIIYATTRQVTYDTSIRLNWNFSPTLTLEGFYQPFKVDMDYETYNHLVAEKTNRVESYHYTGDKDFKINNQVGTFVLRWEYRPGSLVYIVYNLNDNRYYSSSANQWFNTKANSLFVKLNYFFQT